MESSQQPAGWYDDPEDASQLRYWDGSQWTDNRNPKGGAPAPAGGGYAPVATAQQGTNGKATASLVLGICSFLFAILAIPGLIFGLIARKEIAENPGQGGAGMATAGIVCSIVFGILGVIVFIAVYS
jgi:hypothetical protein